MIEIETTKSIINLFETIGHDPQHEEFCNKEWISKDSLLKELYKILNNATDKNPSSNKIPKRDIDLLILELEKKRFLNNE